jgi:two-component system, OmpR family, sensor histidine kinase KdpD
MYLKSMRGLRLPWKSFVASNAAIALLAFAGFRLHFNNATVVLLFLFVVVMHSLTGRAIASAIVAMIAAGCLAFFFLPPIFSFRVDDPLDELALSVFVIVALVVSWQVSRVRVEAQSAQRYSTELEQVYRVAIRLLLLKPDEVGGIRAAQVFRDVLACASVCLFDANTTEPVIDGVSRNDLGGRTSQAYIFGKDIDEPARGTFVRCLKIGNTTAGAIGFEGLPQEQGISPALAVLASVAVERASNSRRASSEAAAAQTEIFRTAILDALAHEFKTPLATVLAVVGGLRESERLEPEELEMAGIIESEISRLSDLTVRLLRLARLDREDVRPRAASANLFTVVERVVQRYATQFPEREITVTSDINRIEATVDAELLDLALAQLIDNATKYSVPDSAVAVQLAKTSEGGVEIRVANEGGFIAPGEQERIFERFYRGADVRSLVSGVGLGLYVARKIVVAHGGTLALNQTTSTGRVVFCLRLPLSAGANQYVGIHA